MNLSSGLTVSAGSQIRIGAGGEQFNMDVNLNGAITGGSSLSFTANGGNGTSDIMNLNVTASNAGFSGNWSINSIDTGYGYLNANAADALGLGAVVLNNRSALVAGSTGSLDSLQTIYVNTATSILRLTNSWGNSSASLFLTDGTLDLADSSSTVGSFTIDGNAVDPGTYSASDLTNLGHGGTFSGTGSIEIVPEPSSTALLGLGGLALILRRRK